MQYLTSLDGVHFPRGEATIPVDDPGLLRGDGAFEVVRIYRGKAFALADHLDRLARSSQRLELDCPIEMVEREIEGLLEASGAGDCLLRVVLTRGSRRILMLEPMSTLAPAVTLGLVTHLPTPITRGVKSLSYAANMHATRMARSDGNDEALLVTPDGDVLETPTATVFWATGGQLRTPSLDVGILASISRERLMTRMPTAEGHYSIEDLLGSDEAFITSTVREVQPVSRVASQSIPHPGPFTLRAQQILRGAIEEELGVTLG